MIPAKLGISRRQRVTSTGRKISIVMVSDDHLREGLHFFVFRVTMPFSAIESDEQEGGEYLNPLHSMFLVSVLSRKGRKNPLVHVDILQSKGRIGQSQS